MRKTRVFSMIIVLVSISVIIGVKLSNNHKECETKTEVTYGNNGEKIVSEIHFCKEKFNL